MVGVTSATISVSGQAHSETAPGNVYDPFAPILHFPGKAVCAGTGVRSNQRARRSRILAAIRRLLTEAGCENVTVRDMAEASGCVVQTIYNLVGPRNEAISDAISEYSLFVGRTACPKPQDPTAFFAIVNRWMAAIDATPDFCRQSNMIYFTPSREIYYRFRERQLAGLRNLLRRQQNYGIILADANIRGLAEHIVLHASALWLEWSDRPFPVEQLRQKLCGGAAILLSDSFAPKYRGALATWRDPAPPRDRWC